MIEREGISTDVGGQPMVLRPGTGMPQQEIRTRLRALLGDDGFQAFMETSQASGALSLATQLAGNLYFTDTPLTPGQANQLAQIAADLGKGSQTPGAANSWDLFFARAQTILSPPQMEALNAMHTEETFQRAMGESMKRWMSKVMAAPQKTEK